MDKPFIIKSKDTKTTTWAGGKTTELYIYPEDSVFKDLKFDFRLSTATIEIDESTFTKLPNTNRTLLLLDGELTLEHEGHHTKKVVIHETDSFKGDWNTKSKGKAIDFNFMSTKEFDEVFNVLDLKGKTEITEYNFNSYTFLYVYKGELKTSEGILSEGDILVNPKKGFFSYSADISSTIVHLTIDTE